jgi:heme-degrading monooxygenase HmoA/catechol 2,3-dioxygenase-like lactoylglutathione lyase family enzyme
MREQSRVPVIESGANLAQTEWTRADAGTQWPNRRGVRGSVGADAEKEFRRRFLGFAEHEPGLRVGLVDERTAIVIDDEDVHRAPLPPRLVNPKVRCAVDAETRERRGAHVRDTSAMAVEPRLSLVTLGVDDIPRADAFYSALGWEVLLSDADDFRLFRTAGALLALYARSSLQRDMGRELPTGSGSVQLAMNLDSRADVDAALVEIVAAGGTVVAPVHAMDWGGYSAYIADPDGHIWEIAHNPGWVIGPDGRPDVAGDQHLVTVFRSRLRPEATAEYDEVAPRMDELARSMPGFVDLQTFTADDGERVTIARFDTVEHQRAWRDEPDHLVAQRAGRDRYYSEYLIQVCALLDERTFTAG